MATSTLIPMNTTPQISRGFTLAEIMVAVAISSILMAGVLTVMSTSKRTYALQTELVELNDNARFIMDEFQNIIREAGYSGCKGVYSNPFWQNGDSPKNDQDIEGNPPIKLKSDILTVEHFSQLNVLGVLAQGNPEITLDNNSIVPQYQDRLTIKDCGESVGQLYTVNSVVSIPNDPWAKLKIPISPSLWKLYQNPVDVFLGDLVNPANRPRITYKVKFDDGVFSLFKCPGTPNSDGNSRGDMCDDYSATDQETFRLIEGVQNLQVRYGVDTDGNTIPDRYDTDSGANNGRIVSVRITLLMRTVNKRNIGGPIDLTFNLDADHQYNPSADNSADKNPEEGYYHRVFTSTILVRNSIYPMSAPP